MKTSCSSRRVIDVMKKTFHLRRESFSIKLHVSIVELCMYMVNVINEPSSFRRRVMYVPNFLFWQESLCMIKFPISAGNNVCNAYENPNE